ncbi:hypothetical protein PVAND_001090 [Polypedilum vanderplanki]|uniref:Cytochrome P450 n=1 Tax=Polypedilum vanderplanki TaxID=319348 RepID=A0A9J6BMA5_POLVA|nr:hypothetical protein PVAND_001090 [Polypedilum vanderplanki]
MFTSEILFLTILVIILGYFWNNRRFWYLIWKIPKVAAFDMTYKNIYNYYFGNTKILFKVLESLFERTKGISIVKYFPVVMVNVVLPEDIKFVFNSKVCIDKPRLMIDLCGLSEGTLFGKVKPWQAHRKVLNFYFTQQSLRSIIPIFNKRAKILMNNLSKSESKGEFNVFHNMTALSLETILSVMELEIDIQNLEEKDRDIFIKKIENKASAVMLRIFKFWLHPDYLYSLSKIYEFERKAEVGCSFIFAPQVVENIREKLKNDENNNNEYEKPKTFIRAFLDPKNNFTEHEIFDEIKTLIVAAQDTSAVATSSTLLLLGMFKDKQEKVVEELRQILGNFNENENLDIEQLNELKYLEMVINESMRLMPVVPLVGRRNLQEITLSEGYTIPINSTLMIPIFKIHRSKEFWGDDADKFKPERFEPEEFKKIHPYVFIPFAKGPRMCLGWRYAMYLMKIQLARILLKYEIDTSLKLEELEYKFSVSLNVCQGYKISIKKRE